MTFIPGERVGWQHPNSDPFAMPYKHALAWAAITHNIRLEAYARGRQRGVELNNMPYQEYLLTPEWRATRAVVLARAKGICEGCGVSDVTEVHHLTYVRRGGELATDLVAVCRDCHGAQPTPARGEAVELVTMTSLIDAELVRAPVIVVDLGGRAQIEAKASTCGKCEHGWLVVDGVGGRCECQYGEEPV